MKLLICLMVDETVSAAITTSFETQRSGKIPRITQSYFDKWNSVEIPQLVPALSSIRMKDDVKRNFRSLFFELKKNITEYSSLGNVSSVEIFAFCQQRKCSKHEGKMFPFRYTEGSVLAFSS